MSVTVNISFDAASVEPSRKTSLATKRKILDSMKSEISPKKKHMKMEFRAPSESREGTVADTKMAEGTKKAHLGLVKNQSFGTGHKKMEKTSLGLKSSTLKSFKSFKTKLACKTNFPLSYFLFKPSMFLFTAVESRQTFIDACMEDYRKKQYLGTIYEIVQGEWPRLYCDIEMEFASQQSEETHQSILRDTMQILIAQLGNLTGNSEDPRIRDHIMTVNHRFKKEMWILSAHVIFPRVMFEHNTVGMKQFVNSLDPILQFHLEPSLVWIKKCKHGTEKRTAIDQRTYSNEQAFRSMFTSKEGNRESVSKPYDIRTGQYIVVNHDNAADLFSRSVISKADTTGCIKITDEIVSAWTGNTMSRPKHKQIPRVPKKQPRPDTSNQAASGSQMNITNHEDRKRLAEIILPNLAPTRFKEMDTWLRIGYGISSIYGGDDIGLTLYKTFSATAVNYDEKHCESVYRGSNGTVGMGSFMEWLRIDNPQICTSIQQRENSIPITDTVILDLIGSIVQRLSPRYNFGDGTNVISAVMEIQQKAPLVHTRPISSSSTNTSQNTIWVKIKGQDASYCLTSENEHQSMVFFRIAWCQKTKEYILSQYCHEEACKSLRKDQKHVNLFTRERRLLMPYLEGH